MFTQRVHIPLVQRLQCFTRSHGKCHVKFVNAALRFGSLITCSRAQGCAGSRYPFLTQKERDTETGLDFFGARYYASVQGRFGSVDPENAGASSIHPQSWNGYGYSLNNPLRFIDPDGLRWVQIQVKDGIQYQWFDHIKKDENGKTAYDRALASGYSAVDFDESKSFEYSCECGAGGDRFGNYRLEPPIFLQNSFASLPFVLSSRSSSAS